MAETMDHRARVTWEHKEYYLGKYSTPAQAREVERKFREANGIPVDLKPRQGVASRRGHDYRRSLGL